MLLRGADEAEFMDDRSRWLREQQRGEFISLILAGGSGKVIVVIVLLHLVRLAHPREQIIAVETLTTVESGGVARLSVECQRPFAISESQFPWVLERHPDGAIF